MYRDEAPRPHRDLGLAMVAMTSRFNISRSTECSRGLGATHPIVRDYHALKAMEWEPAALWDMDDTPEFYQIEFIKGLGGAGLDIDPESQSQREMPPSGPEDILAVIEEYEDCINGRLREYLETHPHRETYRLSDEERLALKELGEFERWARENEL